MRVGSTPERTAARLSSGTCFGWAILPSPSQKLNGILRICEAGDTGILGFYESDHSVVTEICLNWHPDFKPIEESPIVSMIIWRKGKLLFEYFNGFTAKMPTPEDASQFILPVVNALSNYRPMRVARAQ